MTDRVIALIDMDCFYCQVEARINPALKGKPMAVVQYNAWKGGGIIAVNYEAREYGVTRHLRGNDAKQKCPDIVLVQVPELRGKADLTKYRDAGREVVNVLSQFSDCVERASVDEAYIDLTQTVNDYVKKMDTRVIPEKLPNTFVVGCSEEGNNDEGERLKGLTSWLSEQMVDPSHLRLAVAAMIVEEIRAAIFKQTEFRCSAGIAHNKVLSKLVCGLHKPNRQTILPHSAVNELYKMLSIKKVRHLGGKLGDVVMETLGCKVMADLQQFSEAQLQQHFDLKNGSWLYNIARGLDNEAVTPRLLSKSIACCKKFPGKQALVSKESVEKWLFDLSNELSERLVKDQEENNRRAKLLVVSFLLEDASSTRSTQFNSYEPHRIVKDAIELIKKSNGDKWAIPIKYLGLSAGKFTDEDSNQNSIQSFFKSVDKLKTADIKEYTPKTEYVGKNASENYYDPSKDQDMHVNVVNTKKDKNNVSFFTNYFKQESIPDSSRKTYDLAKNEPTPSTSKHISLSSRMYNDDSVVDSLNDYCEPLPNSKLNNGLPNDDSNSSDVMCISPGEIFPDPSVIDDTVAALLPPSMRKKLQARQLENAGSKQMLKCSSETIQIDCIPEESNVGESSVHLSPHRNQHIPNIESSHVSSSNKLSSKTNYCEYSRENPRINTSASVTTKPPTCSSSSKNPFYVDDSDSSTDIDDEINSAAKTVISVNKGDSLKLNLCEEVLISQVDDENEIPGQRCDKCLKYIPLCEYFEHLDFHAAQELHEQLNSATVPTAVIKNASTSTVIKRSAVRSSIHTKKRGRPSKNSLSATDKKMRSITSFFIPSTK